MQTMIVNEIKKTMPDNLGNFTIREIQSGKHLVMVNVIRNTDGQIRSLNVLVQNAAHRAFKKSGRIFFSVEDALKAYKTEAVKAAIETGVQA